MIFRYNFPLFLMLALAACTNRKAMVICEGDCNASLEPPACFLSLESDQIEKQTTFEVRMFSIGEVSSAFINDLPVSINDGEGIKNLTAGQPESDVVIRGRVSGPGGVGNCQMSYDVVNTTPPPVAPQCEIFASASSTIIGQTFTAYLLVTVGTATSAKIGTADVTLDGRNGSLSLTALGPAGLKTFTGEVSNSAGTGTCSGDYTSTTPPPVAPTCSGMSVSVSPVPVGGSFRATLNFAGTVTSATIGGVPATLSGNTAYKDFIAASPAGSKSISGTVTGPGGTSVACSANYVVDPIPAPTCSQLTFSANPVPIGGSFRATLSVSGDKTSATIGGLPATLSGGTAYRDFVAVAPTGSQSFSGTVTGPGGTSSACTANLTVNPSNPLLVDRIFAASFDSALATDQGLQPDFIQDVTLSSAGKKGKTAVFGTSNPRIRFLLGSNWAGKTGMSLSLWVKSNNKSVRRWIFYYRNASPNSLLALRQDATTGSYNCGLRQGDISDEDYGSADLNSGGDYADGNWHHVVCILGADDQYLYVDGLLRASSSHPFDASKLRYPAGSHLTVGSYPHSSTEFLNGSIDEVNVWQRTLTETEALELYQNPPALP